mmetsp:Transcript_13592/g.39589  ORF Transcript_13592/g.39589 Transcript_13592/m.39589 type:complete len:930 (-) Transcript_13592:123-2912(-)|eukprot:CAMPEP_0118977186 /NCGR_PEP_ID=MMETSP1173-20130426/20721_1 /TAXON_ID=1034831 /ORGANISM="Rhizochromulina marina cf, Strain CCMP1243" /LENGTH=929 /DNA_ID=CAMNT_0006927267 /DNA_START=106 /DNA_END=2895 /DNA_ORIENTATION=+
MPPRFTRSDSMEEEAETGEFSASPQRRHVFMETQGGSAGARLGLVLPGSITLGIAAAPSFIPGESSRHGVGGRVSVDVIIDINPPERVAARLPVRLVLVVDTSGSMGAAAVVPGEGGGETSGLTVLDVVKHACRTLIQSMDSRDQIALICFSSVGSVVLPLTAMDEAGKGLAEAALDGLRPGGQTNIWGGLSLALEELDQANLGGNSEQSSVCLLTDGLPNIRPARGEVQMLEKSKMEKQLTCSVNTFGFGYQLDSNLLSDLANVGEGSFSFIPDSSLVGTCFVHALAGIQSGVARRARLRLGTYESRVLMRDLLPLQGAPLEERLAAASIGQRFRLSDDGAYLELSLGNLSVGQRRSVALRLSLPGSLIAPALMAQATVVKDDGLDGSRSVIPAQATLVDGDMLDAEAPGVLAAGEGPLRLAAELEYLESDLSPGRTAGGGGGAVATSNRWQGWGLGLGQWLTRANEVASSAGDPREDGVDLPIGAERSATVVGSLAALVRQGKDTEVSVEVLRLTFVAVLTELRRLGSERFCQAPSSYSGFYSSYPSPSSSRASTSRSQGSALAHLLGRTEVVSDPNVLRARLEGHFQAWFCAYGDRRGSFSNFVSNLRTDLNGQVGEAVCKAEWFNRWGQHYLLSLANAHALQQCNNFKDKSVQDYAGTFFSALREQADNLFLTIPPPQPSIPQPLPAAASGARGGFRSAAAAPAPAPKPVDMRRFHNSSNPCFHSDCLLQVASAGLTAALLKTSDSQGLSCTEDKLEWKPLADVQSGDLVVTGRDGAQVWLGEVHCVVQTECQGKEMPLVEAAPMVFATEYHPVRPRAAERWSFPADLAKAELRACESVISLVLEPGHPSFWIGDLECAAFGHGISDDPVAQHPFFGTADVVRELRQCQGWAAGHITFRPNPLLRDSETGLALGFDLSREVVAAA